MRRADGALFFVNHQGTKTLGRGKNLVSLCLAGYLILAFAVSAQQVSTLGRAPDWSKLNDFQRTISHDDFARLLETVYAPGDAASEVIEVTPAAALIKTSDGVFTFHFATEKPKTPP